MKLNKERKIIETAVRNACFKFEFQNQYRKEIARLAASLADKNGVNVADAPYLQEIFIDAIDENL
jgi:hypothetical protein